MGAGLFVNREIIHGVQITGSNLQEIIAEMFRHLNARLRRVLLDNIAFNIIDR